MYNKLTETYKKLRDTYKTLTETYKKLGETYKQPTETYTYLTDTYKSVIWCSIHCRVLGGLYVAVFDETTLIRKLSARRIDLCRF